MKGRPKTITPAVTSVILFQVFCTKELSETILLESWLWENWANSSEIAGGRTCDLTNFPLLPCRHSYEDAVWLLVCIFRGPLA